MGEWIPVYDGGKLPEIGSKTLITRKRGLSRATVQIADFIIPAECTPEFKGGPWWWFRSDFDYTMCAIDDVVAWMPLPEPYAVNQKELDSRKKS